MQSTSARTRAHSGSSLSTISGTRCLIDLGTHEVTWMRFLPPYIPGVPLRVWRAIGVMKTTRRLTAIIERDDEADVALCPELDIASQGDTVESARKNLIEALELFFESADSTEIARRLQGAGMVWILSKQPVPPARSVSDRFRKVVERCPEARSRARIHRPSGSTSVARPPVWSARTSAASLLSRSCEVSNFRAHCSSSASS